ncbi:unnamed protein product, partial [Mesorhabditis belari]|uniref:Uncharacterized protein n=1 Tax=Mesorhabditis belari TaxID=2138241 RepID=A0AAF3FIS3_9BILA
MRHTVLLEQLKRYDRPGFVLGDWLCKPWSPPNEELDEEETDEEPETTTRSRIHHDKHREKNEKNEKKSSPMIDHDEFQFITLG